MSTNKEAWGVEVGAQAIKVMKLVRSGTGVAMDDFDVMPFKQVLTTPDLNVEEAIRVNLEALAQKYEFDKSAVVVSVPGHMAFARFAKLPPVESKNVKSIVAFEAKQQIPFPLEEVEWDFQVFEQDDAPDVEVGIFAITKERVANFLSNYRSVGMRVDTLTLSPVAVYNAFAYENEGGGGHGDGTVYLDIGSVSTDIIVVEDGGIWLRTLPLGGNHFTQALMKQFKISFAKAEKLKLEAATSKYAKQMYVAMRGVFNDLVTEIQRSLGFYTSLNRDSELDRIVGVGSTWKLPGLQKYLKQNLQMNVMRPDGFTQLEVEDRRAAEFSSVAVNMATCYGLALQGLGMAAVDANILPQTLLRQRMWKAKQPWFGAAAACVVGGAALGPAMMFLEGNKFNSAWDAVEQDVNSTIQQATAEKNAYVSVQTSDPRPGIRNFRRGYDYTNLYPKLLEDVSSAMATIEPNQAIKNVNWNNPEDIARVAEIPRNQRGLVWVTEIQTQYKPPIAVVTDPYGDGSGAPPGGGIDGQFSDPSLAGAGGGFATEVTGPVLSPAVPFPDVPKAQATDPALAPGLDPAIDPAIQPPGGVPAAAEPVDPSPRIIVTVKGETTMDGATISRLLQQKFVGWMTENAKRADRPYVLVPLLIEPTQRKRGLGAGGASIVTGTGTGGGDISPTPAPKTPSGQPGVSAPGTNLIQPGGEPLAPGRPSNEGVNKVEVKTPEGWYATLGSSSEGFSLNALLPRRPLSTETRADDSVFTFKFEVILLAPDDARSTILSTEQEPVETPEPSASREVQEDQS